MLQKNEIGLKDTEKSLITSALGSFTKNNKIIIFGSTFLIIIFSIVGITKLEVENSFINYFDKETEIYKGMKKIDDDLGGTTPLNIILKFPSNIKQKLKKIMMNLMSGMRTTETAKKISLNIGLREIKWIKL